MSATTQCPTCNTRFKVSQEQLDAHQGLVRCGRCQAVFNATDYLQDELPSPQLDLPIAPKTSRQESAEPAPEMLTAAHVESLAESASAQAIHEELTFSPDEPATQELPDTEQPNRESQEIASPTAEAELRDQTGASDSPVPEITEAATEPSIETAPEPAPATHAELDFSLAESPNTEPPVVAWSNIAPQDTPRQEEEQPFAESRDKTESVEPLTLAQQVAFTDTSYFPAVEPVKRKSAWPWVAGSLLLLILLLAQAAYFYRIELAATQPGLKPALISYCRLLLCTVPLPQKASLMSIESSDLEADPAQSSVITLNALLRNHAPYTQAYPDLELTLTDAQDKPLARRTFRPTEYLKLSEDETQGITANRELSVKLNLDTADLKPSGYRLFLFYPQ